MERLFLSVYSILLFVCLSIIGPLLGSSKAHVKNDALFMMDFISENTIAFLGIAVLIAIILNFTLSIHRDLKMIVGLELEGEELTVFSRPYKKGDLKQGTYDIRNIEIKPCKTNGIIIIPKFSGFNLYSGEEHLGSVLIDHACWDQGSMVQQTLRQILFKVKGSSKV